MQPPTKPKRPAPDPRGFSVVREDIVPGVPKQAPSPRAMEAAKAAAREQSRPSTSNVYGERVGAAEDRLDALEKGHQEVAEAVHGLVSKVKEWENTAAGSEIVKIQEEQKTKRWVAVIGLITMIVAPLLTIGANVLTRDTPAPTTPVMQSSMQKLWEDKCTEAPSDIAWQECIRDVAIANAPARRR